MRLRFQRRALQQIDRALSYIAAQSPQGAVRVEARIAKVISLIGRYPHSGKKTPIPGVRRIFVAPYPYLIDYFASDEEIVIQRFRHVARKPLGQR